LKKKLGPNLLRIKYKELAPDLTQKRVRFTHSEDLNIVKYYSQYGYDWEKIASHFESRTAIMVKNRFYHIKKKNILDKLLEEVEVDESSSKVSVENIEQIPISSPEEIISFDDDNNKESFQCFVQRGQEVISKTVKMSNIDMFFDFEPREDQLFEKITPMKSYNSYDRLFEEDIFSLKPDWTLNHRFLYY